MDSMKMVKKLRVLAASEPVASYQRTMVTQVADNMEARIMSHVAALRTSALEWEGHSAATSMINLAERFEDGRLAL